MKSGKRRDGGHIELLPDELIEVILCRSSLHKLLQYRSVCKRWNKIISCREQLQNMREQLNMDRCVVVYNGEDVSLLDIHQQRWFPNIFTGSYKYFSSWRVRGGGDGLLVFISKESGIIRVLNPLTLQYRDLPDITAPALRPLSYHIRNYLHYDEDGDGDERKDEDEAFVIEFQLRVYSGSRAYRVFVFISNFANKTLHILTYSSAQQSWEIKIPYLGIFFHRWDRVLEFDQTVYLFSNSGQSLALYDMNGKDNIMKRVEQVRCMHGTEEFVLNSKLHSVRAIMSAEGCIMQVVVDNVHYIHFIFNLERDTYDNTPLWKLHSTVGKDNYVVSCGGKDIGGFMKLKIGKTDTETEAELKVALLNKEGTYFQEHPPLIVSPSLCFYGISRFYCMRLKFCLCP